MTLPPQAGRGQGVTRAAERARTAPGGGGAGAETTSPLGLYSTGVLVALRGDLSG